MPDLALESNGASIASATSFDPNAAPSNMIDGDESSFWSSTGGYPNEFILSLGDTSKVTSVEIQMKGVRRIVIESCDGPLQNIWEPQVDAECSSTPEGTHQMETFQTPKVVASFLKIRVESGYGNFVAIHRLSVNGKPFGGGSRQKKKTKSEVSSPSKLKRVNSF